MSDQPRISVICIYLDAERFLDEAIASVLAQDHRDFELILVDDGSSDSSAEIARRHGSRHPDKIFCCAHPGNVNRGMSASRNLGLSHARGSLISFIDADDVWRKNKLGRQVALLAENPEAAMVCGTVNYWRSWHRGRDRLVPTGHLVDRIAYPPETALALYPLGRAPAPCPSDIMVRRSCVDAVGGFEDEFAGFYEDQAFFVKVYLTAPVLFSSEVWLDYRLHPQSNVARTKRQGRYAEVRRRFLDWLAEYVAGHDPAGSEAVLSAIATARRALDRPILARLLDRAMRR